MGSSKGDFSGSDTDTDTDVGREMEFIGCRKCGGLESDGEPGTDLIGEKDAVFMIESRFGGTGGGFFLIEGFVDNIGAAIVFRLDLISDGGNIDNGRAAGISSPADLCLTRCIAIANASRLM
jgi:hypothetical protein